METQRGQGSGLRRPTRIVRQPAARALRLPTRGYQQPRAPPAVTVHQRAREKRVPTRSAKRAVPPRRCDALAMI